MFVCGMTKRAIVYLCGTSVVNITCVKKKEKYCGGYFLSVFLMVFLEY